MRSCHRLRVLTVVAAVCAAVGWTVSALGQERRLNSGYIGGDQGYEGAELDVRMRGPVHEAFAQPVTFDPDPSAVITVQPPEPVEELPPTDKPEGDNVLWIPGYWSWDEGDGQFIWVSGIWRLIPPGLEWIPGYWTRVDYGWQFISGYWAPIDQEELEYLPAPPESLEYGPVGDAPSLDHNWIPGCWIWRNEYVWRPGFWIRAEPDWIWYPAHYNYTPRGYIFSDGYWDYPIERRGVLFAPVVLDPVIYQAPQFYYSPTVVLNLDLFVNHLFVAPRYRHYYFGDYYANDFLNVGIYPWFSFHYSRWGYDPIYVYHHHHHRYRRGDRDWDRRVRNDYWRRRDNRNDRPPHRWADYDRGNRDGRRDRDRLAMSLDRLAKRQDVRFEKLSDERRRDIRERNTKVKKLVEERSKTESIARDRSRDRDRDRRVDKVKRTESPLTSRKDRAGERGDGKRDEVASRDRSDRDQRDREKSARERAERDRSERSKSSRDQAGRDRDERRSGDRASREGQERGSREQAGRDRQDGDGRDRERTDRDRSARELEAGNKATQERSARDAQQRAERTQAGQARDAQQRAERTQAGQDRDRARNDSREKAVREQVAREKAAREQAGRDESRQKAARDQSARERDSREKVSRAQAEARDRDRQLKQQAERARAEQDGRDRAEKQRRQIRNERSEPNRRIERAYPDARQREPRATPNLRSSQRDPKNDRQAREEKPDRRGDASKMRQRSESRRDDSSRDRKERQEKKRDDKKDKKLKA